MLILKQNAANSVPTPPAGKGTIFLDDSDVLSVKTSDGQVENFPTVGASNTQVVFIDGTALSGENDFVYNKNTNTLTLTGNVAAGNVLTDNLYYANGDPFDLQHPGGANTQVQFNDGDDFGGTAGFTFNKVTGLVSITGNVSAGNVSATDVTGTTLGGTLTTAAQPNITSVGSLASLTVTGNVVAGNVFANSGVIGAGTLEGVIGLSSNAQPNITSVGTLTSLSVTGNVDAGNISANNATFTLVSGTLSTAAQPNVTSLGTLSGLDVNGNLVAANITANSGSFTGNGAGLTNLNGANVTGAVPYATVANSVAGANVSGEVAYAAVANSVAAGNVTGQVGNALVAGTVYTAAQPSITSVGTLTGLDVDGGNIELANGVFVGNGVGLYSLAGANVTGTVANATHASTANTVVDAAQPNITSVGTLTSLAVTGNANAGNLSTGGVLSVTGNANVGNIGGTGAVFTTLGGTLTTAAQPNITSVGTLSSLAVTGNVTAGNVSATDVSGTTLGGSLTTASQPNVTSLGTLTGLDVDGANIELANGVFVGNGVGLFSIAGANVTGFVANATYANSAGTADTVTTAAQPNITSVGTLTSLAVTGNASAGNLSTGGALSVTGNISAGNVSATDVSGTTLGGSLTTAAQPNVTSVGTLTSLNVTGNVSAGNVSATDVTGTTLGGSLTTASQPNVTSLGTLSSVTVSGNATVQGNVVTDDVRGRTNANLQITAFSGNNSIILAPTGTGVIDVNAVRVTNGADPTGAKDLATKEYVDTIASASLHYHAPCRVESPINLNATYNQPGGAGVGVGATLTNAGANAALVIDGVSVNVADRVLVYQQTNQTQNGVYVVTTVGDGSTAWVLTRATDADTYSASDPDALGAGDAFYIQEGVTGAGELYVMNTEGTITFGTTNITFVQISSAQIYSAGVGLDLTGVTFSLANTIVTPGSYGDAGNVSTFTVDQQGRLTAAGEAAIQAPASGITGTTLSSNVTTSSLTTVGTLGSLGVSGTITAANITANTGVFTGNGSGLSALNASNLSTGTVPSGRLSGTYTITVSGSATTAGTVTTAAQPNITSVGTLSSLTVTGNANVGNIGAAAGVFTTVSGNGSALTDLNGSNISTGTIAAARVATLNQNTTGYAATVSSAAQPNITSVGTLTSLSVTGNVSAGNLTTTGTVGSATATLLGDLLTTGSNATAGTVTGDWTLTAGSTWNASYADLAEKYIADASYEPGTVLEFGGDHEVTISNSTDSHRVAGVVSTAPAYTMNHDCAGDHVAMVALQGRVPCKVKGPVSKGDLMVSSNDGHAVANNMARAGTILGKALENFSGESGVIEVAVGRF